MLLIAWYTKKYLHWANSSHEVKLVCASLGSKCIKGLSAQLIIKPFMLSEYFLIITNMILIIFVHNELPYAI